MSALSTVKKHLHEGRVYRRAEFAQWTTAVDRHLQQLQVDGVLTKLAGGLYYYPKKTVFGVAPADDKTLVQAFLKDRRFLLLSPNAYNALGVGTTQLYNTTFVYNHKRHGRVELGGRTFEFKMKPHFPLTLTPMFLLVDLVNNVNELAEDRENILANVVRKTSGMDARKLAKMVENYGNVRTKKFFSNVALQNQLTHAA